MQRGFCAPNAIPIVKPGIAFLNQWIRAVIYIKQDCVVTVFAHAIDQLRHISLVNVHPRII